MVEVKDPYAIYLAFALGHSPYIENNAASLLAAKFGQTHHRTVTMWTRADLMAKLKEHNRNPVKADRPAWIRAHDKPRIFENDQVRDELNETSALKVAEMRRSGWGSG